MTRLFLVRHGLTDWNIESRWQGHSDVPLNQKGLEQAAQTAQKLCSIGLDAIYSSDLSRALQTAQIIANVVGVPVVLDARLREVFLGEWEGMLASDIEQLYPGKIKQRYEDPLTYAAPGGETTLHIQERILGAVQEILAKHTGERVAIVSHGFAIAVLLASFRGLPLKDVFGLLPKNGEALELDVVGT